jgi:hypothetical protein
MLSFTSGSESEDSTTVGTVTSGSERPLGLSVVVETPANVGELVVVVVVLGNLWFTTLVTTVGPAWLT